MGKEIQYKTPCYVFDRERFERTIESIKTIIGDCKLTYSIKANPFLLKQISKSIDSIEACSPGELSICIEEEIAPERIVYSGVVKGEKDIISAVEYGVEYITAESVDQFKLVAQTTERLSEKVKVILRLTSGNQFGMNAEDVLDLIHTKEKYDNSVEIAGIHFYSGTQKKRTESVSEDVKKIVSLLEKIKDKSMENMLVEYGMGLAVDYFGGESDLIEEVALESLKQAMGAIEPLEAYTNDIGLEFGRLAASHCGQYRTKVVDLKKNGETMYALLDGGIHQINYYGQNMAMRVPPIRVMKGDAFVSNDVMEYCLCGSLCTTADVLIRKVSLPKLSVGDIIVFESCGAYSVTESPALFLSRSLPTVYIKESDSDSWCVREPLEAYRINGGYLHA